MSSTILNKELLKKKLKVMAFSKCSGCRYYSETMNWCYDPEKGKNCNNRIAWEDNRMGRK